MSIPKVIHYCWFGNNEKPPLVKKCIESWKEKCPDYQIIEWNDTNFDINMIDFMRKVNENGKLGFLPDYARLWIINKYGGIYLDTDVELLKSLDPLLQHRAFFGFEDNENINLGQGFGSEKNNEILKRMMQDYEPPRFNPASDDDYFIVSPQKNSNSIRDILNQRTDDKAVFLYKDIAFYPEEFFCPIDYETKKTSITKNTYSIHWFMGSWQSKTEKVTRRIKQITKHLIGEKTYNNIKRRLAK